MSQWYPERSKEKRRYNFKKGTYKPILCVVCHEERAFRGANGHRKFCSDKCRRIAYNAYHVRYYKEKRKAGICPQCGQARKKNDDLPGR